MSDRSRDRACVLRVEEESVLALPHQPGIVRDITREHGYAACQRLTDRIGQPLPERRGDQRVTGTKTLGGVPTLTTPRPVAFEPSRDHESLHGLGLRGVIVPPKPVDANSNPVLLTGRDRL